MRVGSVKSREAFIAVLVALAVHAAMAIGACSSSQAAPIETLAPVQPANLAWGTGWDENPFQSDEPPGRRQPPINGVYISEGYWTPELTDELFKGLSGLGVNMVIDYALVTPKDQDELSLLMDYLELAKQSNIGVIFPLFNALEGMTPDNPGGRPDQVVRDVSRLKWFEGITGWYVHDEVLPGVRDGVVGNEHYSISITQMEDLYRRINAEDPSRPQLNVWNFLPDYEVFHRVIGPGDTIGDTAWMHDPRQYEEVMRRTVRNTCDVVLIDSYPVGAPWREDNDPHHEVVRSVIRRADDLRDPDQELVLVFQTFAWAQYGIEHPGSEQFPTLDEMRAMLNAAWDEGARGAVAYSWFNLDSEGDGDNIPGRERALENLRVLLKELGENGRAAPSS